MSYRSDIISTVSQSGGRIKLEALESAFDPGSVKKEVSQGEPLFVVTDGDGVAWVEVRLSGLKLCRRHCSGGDCEDETCTDLHACKFYLLNKCTFGSAKCKFGHDLSTAHNQTILDRHGLATLNHSLLQSVFKNNRSEETLPLPCKFYNHENGCTKLTVGKGSCAHLHVCRFFLINECKFGEECKRSHDLTTDDHTKRILAQYGICGSTDKDIVDCFLKARKSSASATATPEAAAAASAAAASAGATSPRGHNPSGGGGRARSRSTGFAVAASQHEYSPEICVYYLIGKCSYAGRCRSYHCSLPHQWQSDEVGTWADCSKDMAARLELLYCSAFSHTVSATGDDTVNFLTMTRVAGDRTMRMRRLETVSAVRHGLRPFATRWRWLWEDFSGAWRQYGEQGEGGSSAEVTCNEIESAFCSYRNGRSPTLTFKSGLYSYTIDFREFTQENTSTRKKRKLWRCPVDVVTDQLFAATRAKWLEKPIADAASLPKTWEVLPEQLLYSDLDLYSLSPVQPQTDEYKEVLHLFGTMLQPPGKLILVQRVQNPLMWAEFSRRQVPDATSEGVSKLLFHQSADDEISGICQQGFYHREISGNCGRGIYFSVRPEIKHQTFKGHLKVVVATVMIGLHKVGTPDLIKPPPVNPFDLSGKSYDSVIDDENSPSLYVVFDAAQCYPSYVVHWDV